MPKKTFLVLAVLAVLFAGCMAMERYVAPRFSNTGAHEGAETMTPSDCFFCHLEGRFFSPKAPASMVGRPRCNGCHLKGAKPKPR